MPQNPIENIGLKYVNGLDIAKSAAKKITISAGAARDSSNTNDIVIDSELEINGAITGANGADTAAIVLNSFYAVYVIGDSTRKKDAAGLLSLETSTPTLPFGYDMYRRIGWVLTDGSANILQFWQYGNGQERMYYYDVAIAELAAGAATSYTEIDLASSVPPIATEVLFSLEYTPASAGNTADFLPFGSSSAGAFVNIGAGVAAEQFLMVTVPCRLDDGVPKIQYKVTASDALDLATVGFKDYLT